MSILKYLVFVPFILSSCILFDPFQTKNPEPKVDVPSLPDPPETWEEVLDRTTLPILQTNLGGDVSREWRFANSVLGSEVWVLDEATQGGDTPDKEDVFTTRPELLALPVTETGWPRDVPERFRVTVSTHYQKKYEPSAGELRDERDENNNERAMALTGLYVVTWKGRTLSDEQGNSQFSIMDTVNDGDPHLGTQFLPAGDNRMVAKVRSAGRGIAVSYRQPDPADPIRDIKIWTPRDMGSGLDVDISAYDSGRLGQGKLSDWNTEPAPGEPDPRWHPKYLEHLKSDASGVLRFMGMLNINGLEDRIPLAWADRTPAIYSLGSLVGVDPVNYLRHPLKNFKGRAGMPYEWILDLCNTLQKDVWLQVPHTSTEDHIAGLAALTARNLDPDRRVWFEFSNELWNSYTPYLPQYTAADQAGKARGKSQGWGSGLLQGQALRTFEAAWFKAGGTDERLINIAAGFAISTVYNQEVLDGMASVSPRLAEVLAITTYFGHSLTEKLYSLNYGSGSPSEDVYQEAYTHLQGSLFRDFEAWNANAQMAFNRGVGLVAYEGGSHILASGLGDWNNPQHAAFMRFLENLHKHPVMGQLYKDHWALWSTAGGRTASLFTDIGGYGFYGYWGAKEDVTETPDESPRWKAAQEFVSLQTGVRDKSEPLGSAPVLQAQRDFRAEAGVPLEVTLGATGGDGTLRFSMIGGSLTPGLALTEGNPGLLLSGTPSRMGTFRIVVRVLDNDGDPDYGIISLIVDPPGTEAGRLVLFDPSILPAAALEDSEGREDFRTRFDAGAQPMVEDLLSSPPRIYLPFSPEEPLFTAHYSNPQIVNSPQSPLTPSGGWVMTYGVEEFNAGNPIPWNSQNDNAVLWIGLRDKALSGWLGSSLTVADQSYGVKTAAEVLVIWRREQMEALPGSKVKFGSGQGESALVLESGGFSSENLSLRFVVRTRDMQGILHYFASEARWTDPAPGRFELADFNNSAVEGKRWTSFTPLTGTLSLYDSFVNPKSSAPVFQAVDFSEVDGVGFLIHTGRSGWHYGFRINRFLAVGVKEQ